MADDAAPPVLSDESEVDDDADDELPPDFYKTLSNKTRGSVSAEAYGDWNKKISFVSPVVPKTEEQHARLDAILHRSFIFSSLGAGPRLQVLGAMSEFSVEPQMRLIQQGDDGDCLYIVESGRFACNLKNPASGEEMTVKYCEPGDVFGELALLYNAPRAASVDCIEQSIVWRLDRDTFNHIVKEDAQTKRARHEEFLARVPLLASMSSYERSQLADGLRTEVFEDGHGVMTQGELGKRFYIVEEGEALAWKDGEHVMSYRQGDYFGELALLRNQPRATTVTSQGRLKVLSCDSACFKRLLHVDQLEEMAGRYT